MTLKVRFSLSLIGYTAAILSLFGASYFAIEKRAALRALRQEQMNTLEKMKSVCRETSMTNNILTALNYINVLKKEPEIDHVACFDVQGRVQAHSDPKMLGLKIDNLAAIEMLKTDFPASRMVSTRDGAPILEWYAPVTVGNDKVGIVQIGFDRNVLEKQVETKLLATLRQLAMVAGSTFLLAILISLALAWSLSRPIAGLVQAVRAIGSGQLETYTPVSRRNDEIGYLAKEIDVMARKLKELDDLKDEFVSSVSHDLRNPLAALTSYCDALLMGVYDPITQKQKTALGYMILAAKKLNLMVFNLLDTAKIKAGRMEIFPNPIDLKQAVENQILLYQELAKKIPVALSLRAADSSYQVLADGEALERVMSNLLANALKYTPPNGSVDIAMTNSGSWIQIDVRNTGSFISPDDLPKLFKQFERLDESTQKAIGLIGTGLGLNLVKQLVELHGGKVWVASSREQGTTFSLALPRSGAPREDRSS